jgi:hypothetical protein
MPVECGDLSRLSAAAHLALQTTFVSSFHVIQNLKQNVRCLQFQFSKMLRWQGKAATSLRTPDDCRLFQTWRPVKSGNSIYEISL